MAGLIIFLRWWKTCTYWSPSLNAAYHVALWSLHLPVFLGSNFIEHKFSFFFSIFLLWIVAQSLNPFYDTLCVLFFLLDLLPFFCCEITCWCSWLYMSGFFFWPKIRKACCYLFPFVHLPPSTSYLDLQSTCLIVCLWNVHEIVHRLPSESISKFFS